MLGLILSVDHVLSDWALLQKKETTLRLSCYFPTNESYKTKGRRACFSQVTGAINGGAGTDTKVSLVPKSKFFSQYRTTKF